MDDDIFTDAEIMGPSHGSFVVFIARGIGIIVAIAVIIVRNSIVILHIMTDTNVLKLISVI